MKNLKNKLKNILFLFASLVLVSCSEDLYDHEIQKNDSGYKITDKSFEELRKDKKFMKAYGEINSTGNSTSKTVMEQNYNFTISDIPAKVIEKNGKTSYTFHIVRDTVNNDYFENLIVGSDSLNQTTAYIAKYKKDFTKPSLINNVPFTKINVNSIIYDNSTARVTECVEKVYSLCNGIPYDCGGGICGFASFTLCSGSSGSSDSGSGVSWGGGGTSTTPVGGGSSTNMENFYSGLQFQQQHWLDEQTSETQQSIFNYLNTNGFTTANKNKIKQLINYLMLNPNVSWNDLMNNRTAFDTSTGDLDNNSDDGFDTTTYSYFNPAQNWSNIPSVIPINKFVGWNRSAHPNWQCMEYSKEQLRVMGYKISNYGATGQTFQIYTTQNGVNNTALTNGLNYLKYALSNNIPVIVGVDNHSGSPNPETDNTTDHFIVIVGMGQDSNGKYFQFYDNASGDPTQGANISNKLYYNSTTGIISGSSMTSYAINNGLNPYKITMIRKSKSL